jgi:uncharacterized protein with PIN domain
MSTRCPHCDDPLVEISLELEGEPVTMASCSRCDTRVWRGEDGRQIDVDGMLSDLGVDRRET